MSEFGWSTFCALFLIACVLVVGAAITDSSVGMERGDHREMIPSGVIMVDSDKYVMDRTAPHNPAELCHSGVDNMELVGDKFQIECEFDQAWGVNKGPAVHYDEALGMTLTAPWFLGLSAVIMGLLWMLYGIPGEVYRSVRAARIRKRDAKARAEREKAVEKAQIERKAISRQEQIDRLLIMAARGQIDDIEYQLALDKIPLD